MSFTVERKPARSLHKVYTSTDCICTEWQISRPRVTAPKPINEFEYNLIFLEGEKRDGSAIHVAGFKFVLSMMTKHSV